MPPDSNEIQCSSTLTDEQLVAAFLGSRDSRFVDELVRRHLQHVNALIFPMVLDESVADDLTQEVFLQVFRKLGQFRGRSAFATWLYRMALNTTYNFLNRCSRSPVEYRATVPESAADQASPEAPSLEAELSAEIEAGLAELSPKLRAAIVLTSLRGLAVQQAAEVENCTAATMYWRIHQARKQLRRSLKDWF